MDENDKRVNLGERNLIACMVEVLKSAVATSGGSPLLREGEIAALYHGDDSSVFVRVAIADVARLHALRDTVLSGDFSKALTTSLNEKAPRASSSPREYFVHVDRSVFAERFVACWTTVEPLLCRETKRRSCSDDSYTLLRLESRPSSTLTPILTPWRW